MTDILLIVWFHFLSDFILQSDKMAINKSSSNKWLSIHVAVYSIPFVYFGLKYAAINYVLHWITDYFSSRATTVLWKKGERHWFFVVIGFDQAIHMTCLFLTYWYLK